VRGACRLYQATPYFPFRALLRQAPGLEGPGDAETTASKPCRRAASTLAPWLSLIATPPDVDIPRRRRSSNSTTGSAERGSRESVDALLAAVLDHPVIVLVETPTGPTRVQNLLAKLAGSANDRWLLVLTRRPAGATLVQVDDATRSGSSCSRSERSSKRRL
jgi:hypothetical protein